jgi:uncharacterized protein (UPF0212 family)
VCGRAFQTRNALTDHVKVHLGQTTCPLCGKVFSTLFNMKRHKANMHRDEDVD